MNCLLLTFDCLPRRWIGCYGSLDSTTRGFDRLAALGTTFDNAISVDVRTAPGAIAGFQIDKRHDRTSVLAAGRPVNGLSHFIASHDHPPPPAKGKSQKRAGSRLAQELHQASAWMRDQNRPALVWVRHPGIHATESPLESPSGVESLLQQQTVIDEELDAFLDEWLECADERWTFVLTSGRGVVRSRPIVGRRKSSEAAISDDLARVPLMVLEGRGESFGHRRLDLLPTTALAAAVTMEGDESPLADRIDKAAAVNAVTIQGDHGQLAVRTADWLFVRSQESDREPGDGLLFEKPQDVCDVFDLRSTQAEEAIRLDSQIEA